MKKKGFDAVAFQRQRRVEIDKATEGMGWEERDRWIMKDLEKDPLWKRLKRRRVDLRTLRQLAGSGRG